MNLKLNLSMLVLCIATAANSQGLTTEQHIVEPITEDEIAAEFVDTCVASYPSPERLAETFARSRFAYEETERTNGGAKRNWDSPFGWIGLTGPLGGIGAKFTPQCEFDAFTASEMNWSALASSLDRELRAHLGPDVTRVGDAWLVQTEDRQNVAIQRVPRGGPNQAILIVGPQTALEEQALDEER